MGKYLEGGQGSQRAVEPRTSSMYLNIYSNNGLSSYSYLSGQIEYQTTCHSSLSLGPEVTGQTHTVSDVRCICLNRNFAPGQIRLHSKDLKQCVPCA
jgi:hypothetical protein